MNERAGGGERPAVNERAGGGAFHPLCRTCAAFHSLSASTHSQASCVSRSAWPLTWPKQSVTPLPKRPCTPPCM